jgi:DNA polymerase beta
MTTAKGITMDYKPVIIDALRVLEARDKADKKPFSVRAYATVLRHLEAHPAPIRSIAEIPVFQGVGEKIKKKMEEIVETGRLEAAEKAKAEYPLDALALFGGIYGIGPVKARELVDMGLRTLTDLRVELHMRPDLLHEKQKAGLFYYEDLVERIPREEMREHEIYLQGVVETVRSGDAQSSPAGAAGLVSVPTPLSHQAGSVSKREGYVCEAHACVSITVVGSYRRGAETSGDVDVLLRVPSAWTSLMCGEYLHNVVMALETAGYIEYILALGEKKCMGIARLPSKDYKARRVDFLITPEHEYACALLYFTGSDMFNVAFRQRALQKGYTLNEHSMTPMKLPDGTYAPAPPPFHTEQDIFRFLTLQYVEPSKRVEGAVRVMIKRPTVVYP